MSSGLVFGLQIIWKKQFFPWYMNIQYTYRHVLLINGSWNMSLIICYLAVFWFWHVLVCCAFISKCFNTHLWSLNCDFNWFIKPVRNLHMLFIVFTSQLIFRLVIFKILQYYNFKSWYLSSRHCYVFSTFLWFNVKCSNRINWYWFALISDKNKGVQCLLTKLRYDIKATPWGDKAKL